MIRRVACLSLVALVAACNQTSSNPTQPEEVAVGLERLTTCTELDTLLREKSRTEMNKSLDDAIQSLKEGFTTNCWVYANAATATATGAGATSGAAQPAPAAASPSSVSETNNQVAGVDEADLVKTDGTYLYLAQGTELRIVKAWPAADTALAVRINLGGTAKKLFVLGDRALVYVSVPRSTATNANIAWMGAQSSDCTYGYSCDFSGDGTATKIVIFDVTDRTAPTVLRTIDMPGSLIAARRIGPTVHTVVSIGDLKVPELESYSGSHCGGALTGDALAAELATIEAIRARNNAKIDAAQFDIGVIAREGDAVLGQFDCSDFYRETQADGAGITTVLSLDLTSSAMPTMANVLSRAGSVYASSSSLYMAVPHRRTDGYGWYASVAEDEASTVHRFQIDSDPTKTNYLASGIVPGHVLNQFAMDEYGEVLRIATSQGQVPDPNVESVLSVLKREGGALKTVGQLGGIAPTEDIRSVRFQGDRGYVVTFKKTDPLFVLDLADPTRPAITGELKIPGFSTYLHPLDASHLLALGYEADDQGTFAFFNGIQLQIFDVTKPTEPTLLHKQVYGTRGSSSSALTDHLGFTFLPTRELLTLPMSICDGGGNGSFGTLSFSGVVAIKVSLADGFTELGRLEEPYPASQAASGFVYGGACSDWWTDSNSVVRRTVVMDEFLYAVSDHRVRVQNLTALGTDVKVVDF
jgi:uncharacterized secreted protein with C-terminal beta-propeller domain